MPWSSSKSSKLRSNECKGTKHLGDGIKIRDRSKITPGWPPIETSLNFTLSVASVPNADACYMISMDVGKIFFEYAL